MSENGGVPFDKVDLTVLGDSGPGGKPVNDEVAELLMRAYREVNDESCKGGATITVKLTVGKVSDGSISVLPNVTYVGPKRKRRAMVAFFDTNTRTLLTQDHRQMTLDNVAPLRRKEEENDAG